jgi:inosine-uridine nucleoside N-ribohydrolase
VEFSVKNKWAKFIPCDEVLVACVINHDVIKTSCDVYATVETKGHYTWGQMVVDWNSVLKKPKNVTIVTDVHQNIYEDMLFRLTQDKVP